MARRAITPTANAIGADRKAELFNVIDFSSSAMNSIVLSFCSSVTTETINFWPSVHCVPTLEEKYIMGVAMSASVIV